MALAAQARIDEEIAKLTRLLRDLQTQRNSFSLISRLPTETLAAIFIYSARDYHSTYNGYPTGTAPSWVNVSYVCRHWRNVALNCPTLWSYLFIMSPRWTEELLARSKQASLKLHAQVYRDAADDRGFCFLRQVMNHIERIQELHLDLPRIWFKDHFLSSPAPRLQSLKITVGYQHWPRSQKFSVFFDGDTPALRTLELSSCPMPWYSFKLNGITTLDLRFVPSQFQQNVVEFLDTLSSMQDLTHLYLHYAVASAAGFLSSAEFYTFQKINLPHLSRFSIGAPLSTVTAFMACIIIPAKAEVRLDCGFEGGVSLHGYASLFSVLAQRFGTSTSQALSSPTFRSLAIDLTAYRATLTFSPLERDCDSIDPVDWSRNAPLKIRVSWFMSNCSLDRILGDISSFAPLMDVQSVHVINPPALSAIWRSMLGHLQDLRYLKLSVGDLPDLAPVLSLTDPTTSESAEGQSDQSPDRMLAPALEELELHSIPFQERTQRDGCPADLQALRDALATRKGTNTQLTLNQCIEHVTDGRLIWEKRFNMVGCWEDGRFRVVEKVPHSSRLALVHPSMSTLSIPTWQQQTGHQISGHASTTSIQTQE